MPPQVNRMFQLVADIFQDKERRGDYLGKTVQVVPHVTDQIQESLRSLSIALEKSQMFALVCVERVSCMNDNNADLSSLVELVCSPRNLSPVQYLDSTILTSELAGWNCWVCISRRPV
jgi:hypothetical protein